MTATVSGRTLLSHRPDVEAMPKGMTMETMDRIILARGQNSRMNTQAMASADEKTTPNETTL